ncbi:MAG: hypothetical protein IJP94_03605, partial [Clostridia bacterium]|nr:hypothetical protein [Clostridia bacterium]
MPNEIFISLNAVFDKNTGSILLRLVVIKFCLATKMGYVFFVHSHAMHFFIGGFFMNIKLELLQNAIFDAIRDKLA